MPIEGLTIIGESINDSVPSTKILFDAGDIDGVKDLAKTQDQLGAAYIDVNVGSRPPQFMAEMVRHVQGVTTKPLAFDTPDPATAQAALEAYDLARAGGATPVLNSISPLRVEMFDLIRVQPFKPLLMVSERVEDGRGMPNVTAEQTYQTACDLRAKALAVGLSNDQIIIDPAIAPRDSEGYLQRLMGALKMIQDDEQFAGIHCSVGLSNFTIGLPRKRADGTPTKSALESALLTRAMPLGLDFVIGSVKRKYRILPEADDALACLDDVLKLEGFASIMRVQEYYS